MILIEDEGQKIGLHKLKNDYWYMNDVDVVRYPLPVGDYILMDDKVQDVIDRKNKRNMKPKKMDFLGSYSIAVDTKRDIQEICGNICGTQKEHERFRDECILAQNNGIKLVFLIENQPGYLDKKNTIYNKQVNSIDDLFSWKNPRAFIMSKGKQKYPRATKGSTLAKAMISIEKKYGVKFMFCNPMDAGEMVLEILRGDIDAKEN